MTESKKFQTTLEMLTTLRPIGLDANGRLLEGEHYIDNEKLAKLIGDSVLAHEMLPVIKQLVDALSRHQNYCRVIDPENFCECMGCQAGRALRSAAPFLDQED